MASAWAKSFGLAWGNAWGQITAPEPSNGPSGGPSWLVGYVPSFGRKPATKRRNKRDELLFLTA